MAKNTEDFSQMLLIDDPKGYKFKKNIFAGNFPSLKIKL